MSKIDTYLKEKEKFNRAIRWKSLIGSKFGGGGGGVGYVIKAITTMEIYHQEYNGAKNYHESIEIDGLSDFLNEATRGHSGAIIETALNLWRTKINELAAEAKAEYESISNDLGLEVVDEQE